MATKIWHVLELLEWTTGYFEKNNIPNPRLDAEVLLGYLLKKSRLQLYLHFDMPVFQDDLTVFRELIKKRIASTPISYLTHHKEFMSLDFYVDEKVLIPRPETEFIVETILKTKKDTPQRLLEIGTGSGVIAIALAVKKPEWEIIATDISKDALAVAEKNRDTHECTDRIDLLHGDLFEPIKTLQSPQFNWIVSNPPYVMTNERDTLCPDIRDYEPHIALFAGEDGLSVIRRLIAEAPNYLHPEGKLIFEIGDKQAESVKTLLDEQPAYQNYRFIKDYAGIERVVLAEMK
ncbi:MAG: peptide chain release factor N(5)-glutamine methyltransferase [Candidatus Poribacteria bacterium]|nr:peptide chain release factor N(5)-glutamine methyltransferase [Candidatus Poribacteria bacterium]